MTAVAIKTEKAPDTSGRLPLTAVHTTAHLEATDAADAAAIVHRALESALMEGFPFRAWTTTGGGLDGAIGDLDRLLTSITAHRNHEPQEATSER